MIIAKRTNDFSWCLILALHSRHSDLLVDLELIKRECIKHLNNGLLVLQQHSSIAYLYKIKEDFIYGVIKNELKIKPSKNACRVMQQLQGRMVQFPLMHACMHGIGYAFYLYFF